MKNSVKALGLGLAVLALSASILIALLTSLVDLEAGKKQLAEAVRQATGRDLDLPREVSFTFFPRLSLETGPLILSNAKGFHKDFMLRAEKVRCGIRLLPLFNRQLELGPVLVQDMTLNITREQDGRDNWTDLLKDLGPGLFGLFRDGLTIAKARVLLDDNQAGRHYAIEDLNIELAPHRDLEPFAFSLSCELHNQLSTLGLIPRIRGRAIVDSGAGRCRIEDGRVELDVWGSALNRKAYAELGLCLDLDVPGKNVRVSGLSLDFLGLKATGSLYLDLTGKAPALSGRLRLAEFSPKGLAAGLGLELPTLADPAALNSLAAEFSFSAGRETTLDLDKAVLDGSRLQGRARITDQGREVRFSLAMDRLDLDRYLPRRPEAGRACWPKPLNGLDLAGEIEIKDLKVKNLRLSEIKTELSASGGVVELGPLSARLYQGALLGRMVLDAAGPGPALCKSGSLRGVDAAALLEDLLGAAPLSGSLHLRARLCPPGPGPDGLKASASFFLRQGALSGVDLADLALNGPGQKDKEAAGSTAFSELSGSLDIAEGRATITGLVLRAPGLLVTGQGGADLSARTLDCLLTADAPGGRATLIRVSGDMARPKYSLEPDRGVSLGNRALLGQGPG